MYRGKSNFGVFKRKKTFFDRNWDEFAVVVLDRWRCEQGQGLTLWFVWITDHLPASIQTIYINNIIEMLIFLCVTMYYHSELPVIH